MKTENDYYLPFIILDNLKEIKKNVVLLNTNTWCAYNNYGGSSFYRYNLKEESCYGPVNMGKRRMPYINQIEKSHHVAKGKKLIELAICRPNRLISNGCRRYLTKNIENDKYLDHLLYGELRLIKFLMNNNINISFVTDNDLHINYSLEKKYFNFDIINNFILNCHPDYWTDEMVKFVSNSNCNIISLGENTAFYKLKYSNNNTKQIKDEMLQRNLKELKGLSTTLYSHKGIGTYSSFKKYNPSIFLINIKDKIFGEKSLNTEKNKDGCSGWETDKCDNDKLIIAKGLNEIGPADMTYEILNNKLIFCASSISFTGGLFIDKNIDMLVKNVFNRFKFNKIFIFGFTKCATTSMALGLRKTGLRMSHIKWQKQLIYSNIEEKLPILNNLFVDGIVLGEDNYEWIDKIIKDYPNSKYIFLDREINDWAESFKRHCKYYRSTEDNVEVYKEFRLKKTNFIKNKFSEYNIDYLTFDHTIEQNYDKIFVHLGLFDHKGLLTIHAGNSLKDKI